MTWRQLNIWGQETLHGQPSEHVYPKETLERWGRQDTVRDSWRSKADRLVVHRSWADVNEAPINDATGFPQTGSHIRTPGSDPWLDQRMPLTSKMYAPSSMSFENARSTSWRKHAQTEWVPLTQQIHTPQPELSAGRVHELMEDRSKSDSRTARGLSPELPKMFRTKGGRMELLDGNHRVTADIMSGRLFTQAKVADANAGPQFERTNQKVDDRLVDAIKKDPARASRYDNGLNNLHLGLDNKGWPL